MTEAATQGSSPAASPNAAPTQAAPGTEAPGAAAEAAPPPAAPIEDDRDLEWSRRFNQLTKREKMILEQTRKNKELQTKWEADQAAAAERARKKKENPFEWLAEEGMTYEELTQYALSGGTVTAEQRLAALEAQIQKDKQEALSEKEAAAKAKQEAEDNYVTKKFQEKIGEVIKASPDFEIVASYGNEGVQMIHEVMETYYNENDGQLLPIEDAARAVEAHLEKELEKVIKSTSKVKKFIPQSTDTPTSDTPKAPNDTSDRPGLDTLTHQAVTSASTPDTGEYLSDEESMRRAAETLRRLTGGR